MKRAARETVVPQAEVRGSFYGHLTALVLGHDDGARLCSYLTKMETPDRFSFLVGRSTDLFWAWLCAPKRDAGSFRMLTLSFASQARLRTSSQSPTLYQAANVHGTLDALARLGVSGFSAEIQAPVVSENQDGDDWMGAAEWCVQALPAAMVLHEDVAFGDLRVDQVTKLGTTVYLSENNLEAAARLLVWRAVYGHADEFFYRAADFILDTDKNQEAEFFLLMAKHAPHIWPGQTS